MGCVWDRRNLLALLMLLGCGIGMKVSDVTQRGALGEFEPFGVIEADEPFDTLRHELVGRLRTKDKGLTLLCDYATVVDTAIGLARTLGANVLKIDVHHSPTQLTSSCHRIEARLYKVNDARPYEQQVVWWPQRRLVISDFRADTADRPFRAATYCGITYRAVRRSGGYQVVAQAYFDPELSYFKQERNDILVLEHEQVHFDLAELYARMLRKRIADAKFTQGDIDSRLKRMFDEVYRELAIEQDRYDSDVYPDPTKQGLWNGTIASRLAELEAFSDHSVKGSVR